MRNNLRSLIRPRASYSCVTTIIIDIEPWYADIPNLFSTIDLSLCSLVVLNEDGYVLMEWKSWVADTMLKNGVATHIAVPDQWTDRFEYEYIKLLSINDELQTLDTKDLKRYYEKGLLSSMFFDGSFYSVGEPEIPEYYSDLDMSLRINSGRDDRPYSAAIIDSDDSIIMSTTWFSIKNDETPRKTYNN